jgi:hypothetical protein
MHAPSQSLAAGPLGQRAYEVADHLASSIGPRPTASEGEKAGLAYAESLLRAAGANTHRHAVDQIPAVSGPARWIDILFLLWLIIAARWLIQSPWVGVIYLPGFLLLPSRLRASLRKRSRSPRLSRHNLIADHRPAGESRGPLIIGAHIDTAGGRRVPCPALRHMQCWYTEVLRGFVLVLAGTGALKMLTDWLGPLSPRLWAFVGWCSVSVALAPALFEAVYLALSQERAPSLGASDYGSSLGVTLAAAEHFASAERRPHSIWRCATHCGPQRRWGWTARNATSATRRWTQAAPGR